MLGVNANVVSIRLTPAKAALRQIRRYEPDGASARAVYPTVSVFLLLCMGGYLVHAWRSRRRRRALEATLRALAE